MREKCEIKTETLRRFEIKQEVVLLEKRINSIMDESGKEEMYFMVLRKECLVNYTIYPDYILTFFSYNIFLWKREYKGNFVINRKNISTCLFEALYKLKLPILSEIDYEIEVSVSYHQKYLMEIIKRDKGIDDHILMQQALDCLALKYDVLKFEYKRGGR